MKNKDMEYLLSRQLEIDGQTGRCTDKVQVISLVHKTGHISLYTRKGKEIKIRLEDLITEIKLDQSKDVIEKGYTLFENILTIKYVPARSKQYDTIFEKANLNHITTNETDYCYEVFVQVNLLVQNSPHLIQRG
jgi:hypothetical protein